MNIRNIFFERTEDENEVRITWSPLPSVILYLVIALFIALVALSRYYPEKAALMINCSKVLLVLLLAYSIVYYIMTKKVNDETRDAMRKGNIKLEGGRLSFKSPFTCIIPKMQAPADEGTEAEEEAEDDDAPDEDRPEENPAEE